MPTLERLGIDQMSAAERIALVQEILDSAVVEQVHSPLSDAKRCELDRRVADAEANPADGISWEQVGAAALARFAK